MVDPAIILKELKDWLINFVEVPNPALNNWAPCPYARRARIENQLEIIFCNNQDLKTAVVNSLSLLSTKEVVVICFDHTKISGSDLTHTVIDLNKELMPKYVVLEDHPNVPELLNGVSMNFGKCGLLILSELSKLNTASDQLKSKGYYNHWPKENIDNVVTWRYK
jgi:hypothetical protein